MVMLKFKKEAKNELIICRFNKQLDGLFLTEVINFFDKLREKNDKETNVHYISLASEEVQELFYLNDELQLSFETCIPELEFICQKYLISNLDWINDLYDIEIYLNDFKLDLFNLFKINNIISQDGDSLLKKLDKCEINRLTNKSSNDTFITLLMKETVLIPTDILNDYLDDNYFSNYCLPDLNQSIDLFEWGKYFPDLNFLNVDDYLNEYVSDYIKNYPKHRIDEMTDYEFIVLIFDFICSNLTDLKKYFIQNLESGPELDYLISVLPIIAKNSINKHSMEIKKYFSLV